MSNYRSRRNYENLERRIFEGTGEFNIPKIEATQFKEICDFIPFNQAKNEKAKDQKGVHFFIDDYQFNRIWNNIGRYIDMLSQFKYVMSPDFSIYSDFPKAIQIYNHYRKHWVGAYLQEAGIKVIPTISWSTPDSFGWCFDGEPMNDVVAVSSIGTQNSKARKKLFLDGYNEMLKKLQPRKILFYGSVPRECEGDVYQITTFQERLRVL